MERLKSVQYRRISAIFCRPGCKCHICSKVQEKRNRHWSHTGLLERVQSEPNLSENGTKFIISVTSLLERLLEYRQVVEGEENKDKRMHSTFNILNFYKDEINREEMYIRYVNKLHELHMVASNHAEAGLTLQLYAKVLNWSDEELPEEMRYRREKERDRKETLYTQVINCFDKGKVWEYALPMCKDLAAYYESRLDYKKLADILKQQASFYVKILEGVPVPSDNPSEPETHYPRQDPSYYRVAYYGKSFPSFVSNKQFIYRGDECLKLATIMNHLTSEFPLATILSNNNPQNDDLKDGEQQFIQICSVKPVPQVRSEFQDKVVPFELRNFYNFNEVDTFQFDRPYHREEKDKDNECKTLCIERTKMKSAYKFPGILRWYEVIDIEIEMLCPIRVAIETLKQYNSELTLLINRCLMNEKLYFSQLEMRLHGIISAAVGGGIAKYHEAFFTREFETRHYDEMMYLDQLKELLTEQIKILQRGMDVHSRMVPPNLQPLHLSLDHEFKKMKRAVSEYSTVCSSSSSLSLSTPTTPGSLILVSYESKNDSPKVSCSSYKDHLTSVSPQDKFGRNYVSFPEGHSGIPPPLPSRLESTTSNQTHSKEVLSVNQMTYSSNNNHTSISSSAGQRTSTKVVYKRDCVIETHPDVPPKIPAKQRPSVSNEPTYQQFMPNIKDSETGAKKGDKLPISQKPSDLVNGFMRKLSGVCNNSSPSTNTKSPALTPNENVPPLPPRKQSLKTLSNSTASPRFENSSVEIEATIMSSTDYQSPKEVEALAPEQKRKLFSKDITLTLASSTQGHEQTLSKDPIYKQCPPLPERIRTSSFSKDTSPTTAPSLQIQTSSLSKDFTRIQSPTYLEQITITSLPIDMSSATAMLSQGREQTWSSSKDQTCSQAPPVPERIRTSSISKDRAHIIVPQQYKQPQIISPSSKDSTTEKISTTNASKTTFTQRQDFTAAL